MSLFIPLTSFTEKDNATVTNSLYKTLDTHARKVQEQALAGMFGEFTSAKAKGSTNKKDIIYLIIM